MPEVQQEQEKVALEPKTEVQEVSPCKLKLTVEISADKVNQRLEKNLDKFQKIAFLPGFRIGKIPRNILLRKFRKDIFEALKEELMKDSFEEATESNKFTPVGDIEFKPADYEIKEGEPFKFDITFDVLPQFDVENYKGIKLTHKKIDVKHQEIDEYLSDIQQDYAEYHPAPNTAAQKGDQIIVDGKIFLEQNQIDTMENKAIFLLPDLAILGVRTPELYKNVMGKKVGDTALYEFVIPPDYTDKKAAGKKVKIEITIKGIKKKVLPEVNEEFAKLAGFENVKDMREKAKNAIVERMRQARDESLRERIRDYLIKNIIFPLPESIVKRQSDLILQDIEVSLINQGKSDEEISKTLKDASSIAMGEAERRLRISLILEKIADKERIFVTEDMVNQRIASLAQLYGTTQEMMKQHLENQGLLRPLRRSMRNEMVYDFLLKNAVVEEID